jgi:hypothetical protein
VHLCHTSKLHSLAFPQHCTLHYSLFNIKYRFITVKMGQRQNRKRVRHRPNRSRKHSANRLPLSTSQSQSQSFPPTAMSVRYSYVPPFAQPKQFSRRPKSDEFAYPTSTADSDCRREDAYSRDLRVFGGLPEDQHELSDLRGPMLDVVLGLFDGIDYDDEMC